MALRVFRPSEPLRPYVTAIWDYDDLLGGGNLALSILPDTATYLCFLYADLLTTEHRQRQYTTRSGVAGFQNFRSDLGGRGMVSGVSARLTPWGLSVFRRGMAMDCADRRVDCRDVFAKDSIERIEDRLARLPAAAARVQYVEQFLLSVLDRRDEDRLVQAACQTLDRARGNHSIAALARTLNLSKRTLERRFQAHIGTTPKKYARVVRLRHALQRRTELGHWADVAYASGYYDQSHMIHDFRELYGMSPDAIYPRARSSPTMKFSGLLSLAGVAAE